MSCSTDVPDRPRVPWNAPAELSLLGSFALRLDAEPLDPRPAVQRLLAFLALNRPWLSRTQVATALWPGSPEVRALASLRSTLWRLPRTDGAGLVESSVAQLRLSPVVRVDLYDRERTALRLLADRGDPHDLPRPAELSHDVLPGWQDDWVEVARERFRQLRLHALEALCLRLTAAGRYADALDAGLTAVVAEPLRESAHRRIVETHLAEGNTAEAHRQYLLCRRLLQQSLGVEPSAAMRRLVADVPRRRTA